MPLLLARAVNHFAKLASTQPLNGWPGHIHFEREILMNNAPGGPRSVRCACGKLPTLFKPACAFCARPASAIALRRWTLAALTGRFLLLMTTTLYGGAAWAGYADDNLTRGAALNYIGAKLFGISLDSVNRSNGINADYNDWGKSPGLITGCKGYIGGHSGIDMQTKDVSGGATADRAFYALNKGVVLASPSNGANAIAVYNESDHITVLYLHARQVFVTPGTIVDIGDKLGIQGNEGLGHSDNNSNEHVHVELRSGKELLGACGASTTLDPLDYLYDAVKGPAILTFEPSTFAGLVQQQGVMTITAQGWNSSAGRVILINSPTLQLQPPASYYEATVNVASQNWADYFVSTAIGVNLFAPSSMGNTAAAFGAPGINTNFIYPVKVEVTTKPGLTGSVTSLGESYYPFRDVRPNHWARCYIMKLWRDGIANGSDGLFRPSSKVTRAEFLKMALNIAYSPSKFSDGSSLATEVTAFKDADFAAWQRPYVNFAAEGVAGEGKIISGSACQGSATDRCFHPNAFITRSEAIAILVRSLALPQIGAQRESFPDAAPSQYPEVYAAASNMGNSGCGGADEPIVRGFDDGTFRPDAPILRDQAAKIIAVASKFKRK